MASAKVARCSCTISVLCIVAVICHTACGKVVYVDDDATGDSDGTSWTNAYVYLQDALADANDSAKPIEVRVAQGVYRPDQGESQTPGSVYAAFRLRDGVALIGGYAGAVATDPNARDVQAYPTVLSGDLNGDDGPGFANYLDNTSVVVVASGVGRTAVLDGFTVSGGHGFEGGPGISCYYSDPQIRNCTIARNIATWWLEQGLGGGMFILHSSPTVADCTFEGNYAMMQGGGVWSQSFSWPRFVRCRFVGNVASDRGGGVCSVTGAITLTDCLFEGNSSYYGGAVCNGYKNELDMAGCVVRDNLAMNGGAVYSTQGRAQMANSVFSNNRAVLRPGAGPGYGSQGLGGALHVTWESQLAAHNCTFVANAAAEGSSLACEDAGATVGSVVDFSGCIMWDRTGEAIVNNDDSEIIIQYSDVAHGWPGQGNIDLDPQFVDPGHWDPNGTPDYPNDDAWVEGDYRLMSEAGRWDPTDESWVVDGVTSPCIDGGDPNSPVALEPLPNGGVINMGAYGGTVQASKSPSGLHARYGGGTGELDDPYLIYTADHLDTLGAEPNDYDKHFKLMAEIDLSGSAYERALVAPDVDPCDPGFQGTPFAGVFDGNWHAISHLTISGAGYLGLFGQLRETAEVKNLGVTDVDIAGSGDYIGALAGYTKARIAACFSTGSVAGDQRVGGLVGRSWGSISMGFSEGTVTANDDAGGLAANNYGQITTSYSTAAVVANRDGGGLVAENYGSISASYSTGPVSGDSRLGGLVAYNWTDAHVTSSFWDVETSGLPTSDGGTGKTTAEMQTASTFLQAGWDFTGETENGTEGIWWILEGQDYPRLLWELPGAVPVE